MAIDAKITVDTKELDKAAMKVQNLISLVEKLFQLCKKSKLLSWIIGIDHMLPIDVEGTIE